MLSYSSENVEEWDCSVVSREEALVDLLVDIQTDFEAVWSTYTCRHDDIADCYVKQCLPRRGTGPVANLCENHTLV